MTCSTEIDEQLFGSTEMAESAFKLCVALFEGLLDEITTCFPGEVGIRFYTPDIHRTASMWSSSISLDLPASPGP